jgi:hypothetical protein
MLTENQAAAIWQILVETCGASPRTEDEADFVYHQIREDCREWRFCGSLGFGGKFRIRASIERPGSEWKVDCYSEDETPQRRRMVKKANAALENLYQAGVISELPWKDAL